MLLASIVLLGGCNASQDPTIEAGAPSSITSPAPTTTSGVPTTAFEGGITQVSTPPTETALLDQVTLGRHAGFDRVVFRFTNRVPGYRIGPIDPPITEDGSGAPVTVRGTAYLEVVMSASGFDTSAPEGKQIYHGPKRVTGDASTVTEVVRTGDFEAVLSWVIGLSSMQPFRVTTVSNPPRLVIDIKAS